MFELGVGIVSWNTREMTLDCLASLTDELARLRISSTVWVVDNASDDGSPDAIAREFPAVVVVRNRENVGFAAANNQFLRDCRACYYLLLNPDTIVHAGALAALLKAIVRQPGAGAVGPRLILADGSTQRSFWSLPSLSGELRYNLAYRFFPFGPFFQRAFARRLPDMTSIDGPIGVDALSMACLLIDRRILSTVGFLSEDYFLFSEENDLFVRTPAAGWRGFYVPAARVTHFVGQSRNRQHARRSQANFFRSRTRFFAKHHPESVALYRRMSLFFLTWSQAMSRVLRLAGRAAREDVLFYGELKGILAETIASEANVPSRGSESTC